MGGADDEYLPVATPAGAAPRPRSRRASLRQAALARFGAAHPGEVVAAVGGFAYLLGYLNLRSAAAGLGVGLTDLTLSTNDFAMSAGVWALSFAPFVAGYVWLQRLVQEVGWRSMTGFFTATGAAGTAAAVVVITATVSSEAALGMLLIIGFAAGAGWWLGGPGLSVVLTIAIAALALSIPTSYAWGNELKQHPAEANAAIPPWLGIVLVVGEGTARFSTGAECAVRISDRVYVTTDAVRVEPAGVPFQPDDCVSTR